MKRIFTVLAFVFAGYQASAQCNNFFDDFESGTFLSHWTLGSGYTQSVNTTAPAVGTYSLLHTGSGGHLAGSYATFTSGQPTYISYHIKSDNMTSANAYVVIGGSGMATVQNSMFFAYITSGNQMRFYNSTGQNFPIVANQWYHIELQNINWTAKTMDVYMDGNLILSGWAFRDNTINSIDRVHLYNLNAANASYDEFVFGAAPLTGTVSNTICYNDTIVVNGTQYHAGNPTGTEVISNVGPNNCDSTVTISLNVLPAIDNSVTNNAPSLTANEVGATYQWLDCDNNYAPINGETSQNFTATSNGNYAVEITVGSCVDTSACENVSTIGFADPSFANGLSIYPNPTNGILNINMGAVTGPTTLRVLSIEGKQLESIVLNQAVVAVDLSSYANGMYILEVVNNNNLAVHRIIKR